MKNSSYFFYGREYLSNAKRGCFLRQDQDVCGFSQLIYAFIFVKAYSASLQK